MRALAANSGGGGNSRSSFITLTICPDFACDIDNVLRTNRVIRGALLRRTRRPARRYAAAGVVHFCPTVVQCQCVGGRLPRRGSIDKAGHCWHTMPRLDGSGKGADSTVDFRRSMGVSP